MRKIQYFIRTQFGDEGKGKTVQYLCKEAIKEGKSPLVVRYCSGPQASHTVLGNGNTHICASFGSGVLLGVPTLILDDTDTFVDPIALRAEYDVLKSKGLDPKFYVSENCNIITPYDVIANRQNEDSLKNGTCGCGVWETMRRNLYDFNCGPFLFDSIENNIESLKRVREFYGFEQNQELENKFIEDLTFIKQQPLINDCDYDVIIMESSQGLLLDGRFGLKPYITPAQIMPFVDTLGNVRSSIINPTEDNDIEIYLCTRTYTTRHGSGYEPIESSYLKYPHFEANKNNEFQGNFKTGILDIDMINRAIDRCCLSNIENAKYNLVINHMDCIGDAFEYIYNNQTHFVKPDSAAWQIVRLINLTFENVYLGDSPNSKLTVME